MPRTTGLGNCPVARPENYGVMSQEERASWLARELVAAGSGPNVVLAEALEEVASKLAESDEEINGAFMRRRQHVRMLTSLRGKKLRTEFRNIQGIRYRRRGEWEG